VEKQRQALQIHEAPIEHEKANAAERERNNKWHKIVFHRCISLSARPRTKRPKRPHRWQSARL